jgi:hypothetical protein
MAGMEFYSASSQCNMAGIGILVLGLNIMIYDWNTPGLMSYGVVLVSSMLAGSYCIAVTPVICLSS